MERPVHVAAVELLGQDAPDPLAVLRVEAVARQTDQAGHEAVQRILPDEQPQPLALAEAEDSGGDLEQLVGLDLKQRVAGVCLQDLHQGLGVVA
jgi:hypothetical protein